MMPLGAKVSSRPGPGQGACHSHLRCGRYLQVVHLGHVSLFPLLMEWRGCSYQEEVEKVAEFFHCL